MKVLDGTINSRARESRDTRDEGDASSPQPFGIEGSDEVLLPLIEVGEQRGVFLLQFFFSAHTGSIPRDGSIGRVGQGGLPPRPPSDPDVRD